MFSHEWLSTSEITIRLTLFFGVLFVMAIWESAAPRRALIVSRSVRWLNNLSLVILNTFVLRLLLPAGAAGMALFADEQGWGLCNIYEIPYGWAVIGSVIVLDFAIYLQHVMFHALPLLWRIHRVHHADPDFDVTTGLRFHPLEILLSMLYKFVVIIVLGPPVLAVLIFEVLLNATSMFNHGNVTIPAAVDKVLRILVVTPDMHRVHHSIEEDETNCNFGFSIAWWDRLFGTYRDQPRAGHLAMRIGISSCSDPRLCVWLPGLLRLPFMGSITAYVINRRKWNREDSGK